MQTFPQPPKSYSLIKNLLPSVSLIGQTSQIENGETNFKTNPVISSQFHTLIQAVQNSSINDLKSILNMQLHQLQKLHNSSQFNSSSSHQKKLLSDDLIIERLKHLKIVTEVMVERMNQKYKESQKSFKQLDKTIKQKNKRIGVRSFFYWKRSNKQPQIRKIEQTQSTQKKAVIINNQDHELIIESDRKRTRKQDEKERTLKIFQKN